MRAKVRLTCSAAVGALLFACSLGAFSGDPRFSIVLNSTGEYAKIDLARRDVVAFGRIEKPPTAVAAAAFTAFCCDHAASGRFLGFVQAADQSFSGQAGSNASPRQLAVEYES